MWIGGAILDSPEKTVQNSPANSKNNIMNSDTWSRFQQILPQVEDYQAWDRCLRIRKALEQKGYQVSLVEY